jgi:hypothetical protein
VHGPIQHRKPHLPQLLGSFMRSASGLHPESTEASAACDLAAPPFPPSLDPSGCAGAFDAGPLQAKRSAARHAQMHCAAPRWRCSAAGRTTNPDPRIIDTAEAYAREGNRGVASWLSALR